jgi:ABC-2 type transport system permease protein
VLRKLNFPKYVIVLSASFSALINLGINLIVVAVFMIFNGASPRVEAVVFVPLLIIEMFTFAIALAFLLGALFVKFRDMNYIWEVFMQGAFYATPIIYPLASARGAAYFLIFNPIAQIVQDLRYVLVTNQTETIGILYHNEWIRLIPIALTVLLALLAAHYFRRRSPYFAEEL